MPYNRPYPGGFVDFPSTSTPIDASALNTMDVGIKTANDQFQTVTTAQRAALVPTVGQAVWDSDLKQLMVYMNASGGNAWQPVGNRIVCASTTRPSSPFEGQEIYETDTQKTLVYSGSAWVETNDLDYSPSATVCTSSTRPATGLFEGQRIYETDTNREFTYSGSGWVQTNQWSTTSGVTGVNNLIVPAACRIHNSANISVATSTPVNMTFNSERYDTDDMHSTVSNTSRITINTAGIYCISGSVLFAANATGHRSIGVLLDGSTIIAYDRRSATSADDQMMTISTMYSLNAGQYVELNVFQTSGVTLNVVATTAYSPEFSATWIGRTS